MMEVLAIKPGEYQDAHCGMILDGLLYAGEVVAPSGKTWFFHDQGGIPLWLEKRSFKEQAVIWVYTTDTHRWIKAQKAWFSLTDETPMHYGFAAYEQKREGFISYSEMALRMLRGENMTDPQVRQRLLREKK
jgi:hypothetical protein